MAKRIYMDYASTTPVAPEVLKAMIPYFGKKFGNPSSIHAEGAAAKRAMDEARQSVARTLQAYADEIIFTSGGTESNNLAIFGAVKAFEKTGMPLSKMHFITTAIEHSSVFECFRELEKRGAKVDYAPVDEGGVVEAKVVDKLLRPETVLVSVGYANNEIGTIQPLRGISKRLRNSPQGALKTSSLKLQAVENRPPIFHTDASQAPLYLYCSPERLGVDLLTLDGHKMYGPKGVGVLYARRGTPIKALLAGGGQERGLRSTTENLPGIVGFARAFEVAAAKRERESVRLSKLRDYFYSEILKNLRICEVMLNGDMKERLPNNVNISLPGVDTEMLVLKLDAAGIACSTKSSCLRDEPGSYVVAALGGGNSRAKSTLRFTFGRDTTKKEVNYVLKTLRHAVLE